MGVRFLSVTSFARSKSDTSLFHSLYFFLSSLTLVVNNLSINLAHLILILALDFPKGSKPKEAVKCLMSKDNAYFSSLEDPCAEVSKRG